MRAESKQLCAVYSKFCEVRDSNRINLPILDYETFKFDVRKPIPGMLRRFYLRHSEAFAREILNEIHNVRRFLEDLRCWLQILEAYTEDERFELIIEFIEDRVVLALGRPAALKGRFIYAATKLGQLRARPDRLPKEREIDAEEMKKWIGGWSDFSKFEFNLELLDGKLFQDASRSFRNFDAHRFPPRIEFGLAPAEGIFLHERKITYSVNHHQPMTLELVDRALTDQYPVMIDTLNAFWEMVVSQTNARPSDSGN